MKYIFGRIININPGYLLGNYFDASFCVLLSKKSEELAVPFKSEEHRDIF